MGTDCILAPVDPMVSYAFSILTLERKGKLYGELQALCSDPERSRDCPDNFRMFGDDGDPEPTKDQYGDRIRMVRAQDIAKLQDDHNAPALAYVRALDRDTYVAVYWC